MLLLVSFSAAVSGSRAEAAEPPEPRDPKDFNQLGLELLEKGRVDGALAAFERALALKPDFPAAFHNLGLALAAKGQHAAALDAYREALHLDPDFRAALNSLGLALAARGQLNEAIASYRKALQPPPELSSAADGQNRTAGPERLTFDVSRAEVHYNLGLALQWAGRMEESAQEFAEAERLDPRWKSPLERAPHGDSRISLPAHVQPMPQAAASKDASDLPVRNTSSRSRFAVQVAAHESRARAEALARELSTRYRYPTLVSPVEVRGKVFYRVRIAVATRGEANALAARLLRERRLKAWIVSLPRK
ncbi:MAG: tetratricopeptide repeat protein [Terriglobia bacterium]